LVSDNEFERPNPAFRFELHGVFDSGSYDQDLEDFPEDFDENGWPLFGEFDPFALNHPITGDPWHKAPRVPAQDESESDYAAWYHLAMEFDNAQSILISNVSRRPKVEAETTTETNSVYKVSSKVSASGNLGFLKEHVTPFLERKFSIREHSLEFSLLWGEYCRICEKIGVAVNADVARQNLREIGRRDQNLDKHKLWFAYYFINRVIAGSRAEKLDQMQLLIRSIVDQTCPNYAELDIEWFKKFLSLEKRTTNGEENPNYRMLTQSFARPDFSEKKMRALLENHKTDDLPALDLDIPSP